MRTERPRQRSVLLPRMAIEAAERHSQQSHTTLHSLILLTTWSAFEAMVVDICTSTLQDDRHLLKTKPFEKTTLRHPNADRHPSGHHPGATKAIEHQPTPPGADPHQPGARGTWPKQQKFARYGGASF
jgi:hypothetical protein